MNSNRIRSFTDLNFSPFLLNSGTARIPDLNSETGKHVCPAKSSFSDMSYSCTSIRSTASSGTVNGNINSSSQSGAQLSSIVLVFFFISSAGTPAIATWRQTCQWGGHEGICFASSKLFPRASFSSYILIFFLAIVWTSGGKNTIRPTRPGIDPWGTTKVRRLFATEALLHIYIIFEASI